MGDMGYNSRPVHLFYCITYKVYSFKVWDTTNGKGTLKMLSNLNHISPFSVKYENTPKAVLCEIN